MIGKTKWIIKEAKLRVGYMVSKDCLFCKIVKGEIKSRFLNESDKIVVFADVNPVADVHILIVPKKHIENVGTFSRERRERDPTPPKYIKKTYESNIIT